MRAKAPKYSEAESVLGGKHSFSDGKQNSTFLKENTLVISKYPFLLSGKNFFGGGGG